jgi:ligand-binding SRPBCC domain-containing protein
METSTITFHSERQQGRLLRILKADLWLPFRLAEVFQFFADAKNLEAITPPWLNFEILTPGTITLGPGMLIDYRLRLHGIPIRWQSEITAWEPPHRFVDEQRRGPYRLWVHEHTFVEQEGGTLVKDLVNYSVYGGWIIDRILIRPDLQRIFSYRHQQIQRTFEEQLLKESTPLKEQV